MRFALVLLCAVGAASSAASQSLPASRPAERIAAVDAHPLVPLPVEADGFVWRQFICLVFVSGLNPPSDHLLPQRFGYRLDDVTWDAQGNWHPGSVPATDGR